MSDEPKPTTGEWTENTVTEIIVDAFNSAGEVRPSELIAQRHNAALAAAIRDSHKRFYDLVRYCRANLHQAKLITDDEYARLVETGSESARRLEDYEQAIAAAQQPLVDALERVLPCVGSRSVMGKMISKRLAKVK